MSRYIISPLQARHIYTEQQVLSRKNLENNKSWGVLLGGETCLSIRLAKVS